MHGIAPKKTAPTSLCDFLRRAARGCAIAAAANPAWQRLGRAPKAPFSSMVRRTWCSGHAPSAVSRRAESAPTLFSGLVEGDGARIRQTAELDDARRSSQLTNVQIRGCTDYIRSLHRSAAARAAAQQAGGHGPAADRADPGDHQGPVYVR